MKNKRIKARGGISPSMFLNDEQVKRLRDYTKQQADLARQRGTKRGIVNWMIVEFMLFTGLRAAEVCAVEKRDLPQHHGKPCVFVRDGKGHISRTVEIPTALRRQLDRFFAEQRKGAKPMSPLFASEQGPRKITWRSYRLRRKRRAGFTKYVAEVHREFTSRLTYGSLYSKVKIIGRAVGIQLTPHMCRHTYATHLYKVDKDLLLIKDQLGHANIATSTRYANVLDEDRRRQVEAPIYGD